MSRRLSDHYVYRLIPPRPTFHQDMSDEERAIMSRHADYWARLVEQGDVVVYGPVVDSNGSWGLAVIRCDSLEDARALALADPAVSSGMASFDIGTMLAAVLPE
jgi:uncharacterized protein YciI